MSDSEESHGRNDRGERLPTAHHIHELGRDDRRRLVLFATVRSVVLSAALIALCYLLPFTWAMTATWMLRLRWAEHLRPKSVHTNRDLR